MNYRKLISCLLVAVLLLQVVSVGGVASADPVTPVEQMNELKNSNKDIEEIVLNLQSVLEDDGIIGVDSIYNELDSIQKSEIARGMILLLPSGTDYSSSDQILDVFLLLHELVVLPREKNPDYVQQILDHLYDTSYREATSFLPFDQAEPMVEASAKYSLLKGADKQIFTNIIMFEPVIGPNPDKIHYQGQLDALIKTLSEYLPINVPNEGSVMKKTLTGMYEHYFMTSMFNEWNPNISVQPFPVNMDKMSNIDDTEKSELAQWMIDHKPQNGYETVSEVQKEFDAFFEPNSSALLEQFNDIKEKKDQDPITDFIPEVIELLSNKNFIATPDFESLSEEEQSEIAKYMLEESSPPASSRYKSKEQVQYVVQLALQALELPHKIGGTDSREVLDAFFNKQAERIQQQFNDIEADDEYYELIHYYLNSSEVERRMAAFRYERKLTKKLNISEILNYTQSALDETPFINKVETSEEMLKKLINMLEIQGDIERYNSDEDVEIPLGKFPLDVSKLDNLNSEEREQLADHMLSQRPLGGYASFEEIQTAFNKFFPDDNETDPLTVLNTAKSNFDRDAMRVAMENPDLGITLPDGYGALSSQVKNFIAEFLIQYVNKDYKNKEQVQYMMELAVLAQSVWEQKQLVTLKNKLDELSQKLADLPVSFNDQQNEKFRSIGKEYLKRTNKVDKSVFAYRYLYSIAYERLEGDFQGDIVEPMVVLGLLTTPYQSIDKATKVDRMDQWLDSAMNDRITGEAFFNKYKFDRTGALDLSKRAELSPEDQKELAEWLLTEQDSYETVENLQYVFNRFFTAPNVKGNDINNTLTGLDDMMEISFDNKLHWIDVASIQKLDFSGNKTVWVRYKAISDELPGRAVKIVFTANGDSNTDNGSTPNPGGSNGGGSTSTPVTSTPVPTTKQEQIVVDVNGTNGTNLTKTPITRTTETNGTIKDLVKMTEAIAKESVEKAKQLNMNTARIVIPDTKDAVSETRIEVPKAAVKELNDGSLKLEISTENVVISVPTNSIAGFDQDLYFRVVPLKKESERKEVEERAKKEQLIQQVAPNANVRVLARPVEIDTNMQSREVTLTLPLRDSLPTDPAARQQALDNLAIYIEHSDGTKELIQGKLVQLADNSEGIEFTVSKFSTFTLVVVDGLKASQSTHQPYIQGFGADFRPDAFVTRAQMAAMLARNLPAEAATGSTNSVSYKDVSATHWATNEIQKAQSAGIMNGMSNTQFAPEGSITRAQMATIAYRWMQNQQANTATMTGTAVSFTDVSADLWAADAIAYVQSAGLMVGYNDGTFKPDSKLTRAEAVKVLNVMFNRTPLTGAVTPTFSDVPATHWAYADIEAAAQK